MRTLSTFLVIILATAGIAVAQKDSKTDYVAKVKEHLKENTNDPSKLSVVRISDPFGMKGWQAHYEVPVVFNGKQVDTQEKWWDMGDQWVAVYVKFREANPFGALILVERVYVFERSTGKTSRVLSASRVRPKADVRDGSDPFTEAFLGQFR